MKKKVLIFVYLLFHSSFSFALYRPETAQFLLEVFGTILKSQCKLLVTSQPPHKSNIFLMSKNACHTVFTLCAQHPKIIIGSTLATLTLYALKKQGLLPITKYDLYCLKKESQKKAQSLNQKFSQQTTEYTLLKTKQLLTNVQVCTELLVNLKQEIDDTEHECTSLPITIDRSLKRMVTQEQQQYRYFLDLALQAYKDSFQATRDRIYKHFIAGSESLEKLVSTVMHEGELFDETARENVANINHSIQQQLKVMHEVLSAQKSLCSTHEIHSNNLAHKLEQQIKTLAETFVQLQQLAHYDGFEKINNFIAHHEQYIARLEKQ